ncbi:MAG: ABC transporter permease [Chloroflexi bacterium]|nr:ABC transporter permease [Chloroflexota bacterium]MBV9542842.1 ABC transporter permease [Chloroflexota bacterium]
MRHIGQRLLQLVPTLVGALVLVFFLMRVLPGDPAAAMLGTNATPEAVADLKEQLGLDKPLLLQFLDYVTGLARLDLGRSLALRTPVSLLIWQAIWPTLLLTIGGTLVSVVVGVPLGIVAALKRTTWLDYLASVGALLGVSIPVFVWGVLLLLAFSLTIPLFPSAGAGDDPATALRALILPSIATGFFSLGLITRITRSSLLSVLSNDYVRTARSKGLAPAAVIGSHAMRNALIPVLTVIGLNAGTLLGGAVVAETVFTRPGIGRLMLDAIASRDYPVIQGVMIVSVVLVVLLNLGTDLLYSVADPRVRT